MEDTSFKNMQQLAQSDDPVLIRLLFELAKGQGLAIRDVLGDWYELIPFFQKYSGSIELYKDKPTTEDILARLWSGKIENSDFRWQSIRQLPANIGLLKSLKRLDLSSCKLKSLPDSICQLENLETLILSCNSDLTKLPKYFYRLSNLRHLFMDVMRNMSAFPSKILSKLPQLEQLDFENSVPEYQDELDLDLSTVTSGFPKLKVLNLSKNGLRKLPKEINRLKRLEELNIGDNQLEHLPEEIGELQHLKQLNCWKNRLKTLPKSVGNLSKLEDLRLEDNLLEELPDVFDQLTALRRLRLSNNHLKSLPKSFDNLYKLQDLRHLSLSNNYLEALPEALAKCTQLRVLSFDENPIEILPQFLEKLVNLITLYIGGNLKNLDLEWKKIKKLEVLSIDGCQTDQFPQGLIEFNSLDSLIISNTKIHQVPNELANLKGLRFLNLSHNQLKTVPNCIQFFEGMLEIDLSYNQITSLPKDFGFKVTQFLLRFILTGNPIEEKEQERIKQKYPNIHFQF
ncbi:MAG: leucine-rich repeat domain-containing protein [Saprospiraceae bacterium]|nr:leucine-rich repeat domain-containing protein [Saprospiraceae bacterium]